jgi:hypothetical protein
MPYEQAISARSADGRSDIYALGATLYHMVAGVVPFPGDNHLDVVEKKKQGDFTPAGAINPQVPEALDCILARMLAAKPRDRYQTASELIIDLERSQLAAKVPSFADPARARDDPYMQARLAESAEPTRLDPEGVPRSPANGVWLLRYRTRVGKLCKVRLGTRELCRRLKAGLVPATAEAKRPGKGSFKPVLTFAEFRDIHPAPHPRRKRTPPRVPPQGAAIAARRWTAWLVGGGLLLLAGLLAAWLCLGRS